MTANYFTIATIPTPGGTVYRAAAFVRKGGDLIERRDFGDLETAREWTRTAHQADDAVRN